MAFVYRLHEALVVGVKIDKVLLGVFLEVDLVERSTFRYPHLHVELVESVGILGEL